MKSLIRPSLALLLLCSCSVAQYPRSLIVSNDGTLASPTNFFRKNTNFWWPLVPTQSGSPSQYTNDVLATNLIIPRHLSSNPQNRVRTNEGSMYWMSGKKYLFIADNTGTFRMLPFPKPASEKAAELVDTNSTQNFTNTVQGGFVEDFWGNATNLLAHQLFRVVNASGETIFEVGTNGIPLSNTLAGVAFTHAFNATNGLQPILTSVPQTNGAIWMQITGHTNDEGSGVITNFIYLIWHHTNTSYAELTFGQAQGFQYQPGLLNYVNAWTFTGEERADQILNRGHLNTVTNFSTNTLTRSTDQFLSGVKTWADPTNTLIEIRGSTVTNVNGFYRYSGFNGIVWTNIHVNASTIEWIDPYYTLLANGAQYAYRETDVTGEWYDINNSFEIIPHLQGWWATNVVLAPGLPDSVVTDRALRATESALQSAISDAGGNPNAITNTQTGVTLTGEFSGNGAGLTNLSASSLTGTLSPTNLAPTNALAENLVLTLSNGTNTWAASAGGSTQLVAAAIGNLTVTNPLVLTSPIIVTNAGARGVTIDTNGTVYAAVIKGTNVPVSTGVPGQTLLIKGGDAGVDGSGGVQIESGAHGAGGSVAGNIVIQALQYGSVFMRTTGTPPGSIHITSGNNTTSTKGGSLYLSSGISLQLGNGGSQHAGDFHLTAARGAPWHGNSSGTGWNGGSITNFIGAGGYSSNATDKIQAGGNGGFYVVQGGRGGNAAANSGTNTAGNGTTILLQSGDGGNATGSGGTRIGGNSGDIVLRIGTNGIGSTANGYEGSINLLGNVVLTNGFIQPSNSVWYAFTNSMPLNSMARAWSNGSTLEFTIHRKGDGSFTFTNSYTHAE